MQSPASPGGRREAIGRSAGRAGLRRQVVQAVFGSLDHQSVEDRIHIDGRAGHRGSSAQVRRGCGHVSAAQAPHRAATASPHPPQGRGHPGSAGTNTRRVGEGVPARVGAPPIRGCQVPSGDGVGGGGCGGSTRADPQTPHATTTDRQSQADAAHLVTSHGGSGGRRIRMTSHGHRASLPACRARCSRDTIAPIVGVSHPASHSMIRSS